MCKDKDKRLQLVKDVGAIGYRSGGGGNKDPEHSLTMWLGR